MVVVVVVVVVVVFVLVVVDVDVEDVFVVDFFTTGVGLAVVVDRKSVGADLVVVSICRVTLLP